MAFSCHCALKNRASQFKLSLFQSFRFWKGALILRMWLCQLTAKRCDLYLSWRRQLKHETAQPAPPSSRVQGSQHLLHEALQGLSDSVEHCWSVHVNRAWVAPDMLPIPGFSDNHYQKIIVLLRTLGYRTASICMSVLYREWHCYLELNFKYQHLISHFKYQFILVY